MADQPLPVRNHDHRILDVDNVKFTDEAMKMLWRRFWDGFWKMFWVSFAMMVICRLILVIL